MPETRAIQTVYAGYKFRSRTEARWAVLFDALKIPWDYEHEGFTLPSGWYLPDFYLEESGLFVEVKGGPVDFPWDDPARQNEESPIFARLMELARHTNVGCALLCGAPGPWGKNPKKEHEWYVGTLQPGNSLTVSPCIEFYECAACKCRQIRHPDESDVACVRCGHEDVPMLSRDSLNAAYVAARSHRFEREDAWRP